MTISSILDSITTNAAFKESFKQNDFGFSILDAINTPESTLDIFAIASNAATGKNFKETFDNSIFGSSIVEANLANDPNLTISSILGSITTNAADITTNAAFKESFNQNDFGNSIIDAIGEPESTLDISAIGAIPRSEICVIWNPNVPDKSGPVQYTDFSTAHFVLSNSQSACKKLIVSGEGYEGPGEGYEGPGGFTTFGPTLDGQPNDTYLAKYTIPDGIYDMRGITLTSDVSGYVELQATKNSADNNIISSLETLTILVGDNVNFIDLEEIVDISIQRLPPAGFDPANPDYSTVNHTIKFSDGFKIVAGAEGPDFAASDLNVNPNTLNLRGNSTLSGPVVDLSTVYNKPDFSTLVNIQLFDNSTLKERCILIDGAPDAFRFTTFSVYDQAIIKSDFASSTIGAGTTSANGPFDLNVYSGSRGIDLGSDGCSFNVSDFDDDVFKIRTHGSRVIRIPVNSSIPAEKTEGGNPDSRRFRFPSGNFYNQKMGYKRGDQISLSGGEIFINTVDNPGVYKWERLDSISSDKFQYIVRNLDFSGGGVDADGISIPQIGDLLTWTNGNVSNVSRDAILDVSLDKHSDVTYDGGFVGGNDILIWDSATQSWTNKNLSDLNQPFNTLASTVVDVVYTTEPEVGQILIRDAESRWVNSSLPERNVVSTVLTMENCRFGFSQVGQNNKPEFVEKDFIQDPLGTNDNSRIGQRTNTPVYDIAELAKQVIDLNGTGNPEYIENPYRNMKNVGSYKMVRPGCLYGLSFSPTETMNEVIRFGIFRNFPHEYEISYANYIAYGQNFFNNFMNYSAVQRYKRTGTNDATVTLKVPLDAPDALFTNIRPRFIIENIGNENDIVVKYDSATNQYKFNNDVSFDVAEGYFYRFDVSDASNNGTAIEFRYVNADGTDTAKKDVAISREGDIITVGFDKLQSPYTQFGVINLAPGANIALLPVVDIPMETTSVLTYDTNNNEYLIDGNDGTDSTTHKTIYRGSTLILDVSDPNIPTGFRFVFRETAVTESNPNPPEYNPTPEPQPIFNQYLVGTITVSPNRDTNLLNESLDDSISVCIDNQFTFGDFTVPDNYSNTSDDGKWVIKYEPAFDDLQLDRHDSLSMFSLNDLRGANISLQFTDSIVKNPVEGQGYDEVKYA